jgi:hypothetical protein
VAAAAAAGIDQLGKTGPQLAQGFVQDTLNPVARDVAQQLPQVVEQIGGQLLEEEGEKGGG